MALGFADGADDTGPHRRTAFYIALIALISNLGIGTDHAEPKTAVPGRSDDQGDGKVAQRAMRRKAAAVRGRQNRPHTQPPGSFRWDARHQHFNCGHEQRFNASRREKLSIEGLHMIHERMTRACAVSIMNACTMLA